MTFLAPAWLALLLLAGPLLLLHMRSRRRVRVGSLLLWQGVAATLRPRAALRRPPLTAVLALQLLALALTALLLARPAVTGGPQPDHLLLLLDGGWQQNDPGRRDATLEQARKELVALRSAPAARWSLVLVGERPLPVAVRWSQEDDLSDALASFEFTDGEADWTRAAALAARLTAAHESTRVVLLGAGPEARAAVESSLEGALAVESGQAGLDVAAWPAPGSAGALITAAGVSAEPGGGRGVWHVSGRLIDLGDLATEGATDGARTTFPQEDRGSARLTVEFAGAVGGDLRTGAIEVPLDEGQGEFEALLELGGSGVLTLRPEMGYGPPATFVLDPEPARLPVLYAGPGSQPLRRALEATGLVELFELNAPAGAQVTVPDSSPWALVILDRVSVGAVPATSTLWIASPGLTRLFATATAAPTETRGLSDVRSVRWDAGHELVTRTDWATLGVEEASAETLGAGAVELVGAVGVPASPAAAAVAEDEVALVQLLRLPTGLHVNLNFAVESSDWPDRNGFPLFVRDLLRLIDPSAGLLVAPGCVIGEACPLPAGVRALRDPAGAEVPLPRLTYGLTEVARDSFLPTRVGAYTLELATGELQTLAVNAGLTTRPLGAANGGWVEQADPQAAGRTAAPAAAGPIDLRTALLALLVMTLLAEAWLARARRGRWRASDVLLRGAALALVALAFFGLRLPLPAHGGSTTVLVPGAPWGSGAVPGWSALADDLALLQETAGVTVTDMVGSAAGYNERPLEQEPNQERDRQGNRHIDELDLQLDLELAVAAAAPNVPTRVVVVGDGSQSSGDLVYALDRLASRGAVLDAVLQARAPAGELQLVVLAPPPVVLAGDRFELQVVVHASQPGSAVLTTYKDGEVVDERAVAVRAGSNHVRVEVHEAVAGEAAYTVEVRGQADVFGENNYGATTVEVLPAGHVLLVSDNPEWGALLETALVGQGLRVALVESGQFPAELGALLEFQAVVLADVPAAALLAEQLVLLEEAVQHHGLSLLLLGGGNAFGPGGYYETPLERLSPASSLVPRQAPELAIAFVIDRSNSMRQYAGDEVRLDIAKAAVLRAHELLPEGARASLIAFDSTARTLVPLSSIEDGAAFREAVIALEPRGGTAIYPGLEEAYAQLAGNGAAASHVIVMSDGLSQPGDFPGVLARLQSEGVTVSTIGIGPEADADQLREIARLGGGSFHFSADFASLPGIMAHEVLLQTGDLTEERNTLPRWQDRRAPFLRAWPDELPEVAGFVPTSLKPEATMHLSVTTAEGNEVPLLASWRYGAGAVVAFTAHGAGPWTEAWLGLPEFPTLWSHLLRQVARPSAGAVATAPEPSQEQAATFAPAPTTKAYPAALDFSLADPARLAAASAATGGSISSLSDVRRPDAWYVRQAPAWPWLLLTALLLLLVELTLRYAPDLLQPRGGRKVKV